MSDQIDRAAEAIWHAESPDGMRAVFRGDCEAIARALDAAGLLAKYPHLEIEGDWLIEVVNYHTCGAGPGSGAGHEPGCGTIPVGRLATPEHDAAVAAKALREAADSLDGPSVHLMPAREVCVSALRGRADRIEREGGSDA